MNWFTRIFEKPDWRLVKEIQAAYLHFYGRKSEPDKRINEREEEMTYYLYEDQFGNRKFDAVDSVEGNIDVDSYAAKNTWTFRSKEYRYTIKPWLDGRFDTDIPTYESVPRRDFKKALKG